MQTNLHAVSYYFTASWANFSVDEGCGDHGEYVGRSAVEVVNLFGCVWVGFSFFYTPPLRLFRFASQQVEME